MNSYLLHFLGLASCPQDPRKKHPPIISGSLMHLPINAVPPPPYPHIRNKYRLRPWIVLPRFCPRPSSRCPLRPQPVPVPHSCLESVLLSRSPTSPMPDHPTPWNHSCPQPMGLRHLRLFPILLQKMSSNPSPECSHQDPSRHQERRHIPQ